jgi:23S rRNA pseudouridine1911/1915/1917 synthase
MKTDTLVFEVKPEDAGCRLDVYLQKIEVSPSRSRVQQWIRDSLVTVNRESKKANYKLKPADQIFLEIPPPQKDRAEPEAIDLDIVYEDQSLLVVNKPPGMVVHPAAGNYEHTLVNALLHHCENLSGIGGVLRPGIVHRLDKDTSGLLMVAKNDFVHQELSRQLAERTVRREYLAIACGKFKSEDGKIDIPVGRHVTDRKKMSTLTRNGREAVTFYQVLERFGGVTFLSIRLKTGRTHQIRVHLAGIRHPVFGDRNYRGMSTYHIPDTDTTVKMSRQALHARSIGFLHPDSGKRMELDSPVPQDMQDVLDILRELPD